MDFQTIYDDYRPRILRYLTHLVGEFEAEDLTQEVFLRVSLALGSFRGEASLGTWIYRIATNAAVDRLRQRDSRTPFTCLDNGREGRETGLEDREAWTGQLLPSPEQQVFLKEGFDCFCDFLKELPETYRLVVALNQ